MTPQGTQLRVLYIEDAFDQALLVKAFFSKMPGYSVTHAQDGDQAIRLIDTQQWDLLVTDLNLPGTDGFAVIRHMRGISETIPILVTTGYTQAQYEEQALRAGADQVMIKPLNKQEFINRVGSMVEEGDDGLEYDSDVIVVIEGRLGDAEMGCGGTLMRAVEEGRKAIVVAVLERAEDASPEELKAANIAAQILGVELRVDPSLFGNGTGQRLLVQRTLQELRPRTVYVPAPDDRDGSRAHASRMARDVTAEVRTVLGYETATTGLEFVPGAFVDVRKQMVMKMEALAAYQSLGAARVDLRPRMAQAYARYWGRFMDFTEVEAFEKVKDAR